MQLHKIRARTLRRVLNWWPPFLFAGIRVETWSDDWRYARVRLGFHRLTSNFVGTQFGGSLFAMTDPFWMIMTMQSLGPGYIVWDKSAEIDFVAPGRGRVRAEFRLDEAVLDEIRAATANGDKYLRWFETEVEADDGSVIARLRKQVYIRRKRDA